MTTTPDPPGSIQSAIDALDDDSALLLRVLCALSDADRNPVVLGANWADIVARLDRTDCAADPEPGTVLLADASLVTFGGEDTFEIAPYLVAAVGEATPTEVSDAVDQELASYWVSMVRGAMYFRTEGEPVGPVVLLAGRQAVHYLGHLGEWELARSLVERLRELDQTPEARNTTDVLLAQVTQAVADRPDPPLPAS